MSTITIGFFPRERFSLAAESLQRIFDYTCIPFNLIVVDCNTPKVYWQQMEQVLRGRRNVNVIHKNHYLMPNQSCLCPIFTIESMPIPTWLFLLPSLAASGALLSIRLCIAFMAIMALANLLIAGNLGNITMK